jgi:hypothetical protein
VLCNSQDGITSVTSNYWYGQDGKFSSLPPHPNRLWGPPTLLPNGCRGTVTEGEKQPGREADHSHPSRVEVKNEWSYTSSLPVRLRYAVFSCSKLLPTVV